LHQSQDYQFERNIRRSQSAFGRCYAAAQPGNLVGEPPVSTSASALNVDFEREADVIHGDPASAAQQYCYIYERPVGTTIASLRDSKLIFVQMIFRGWKPRAAASPLKATQINN
jgi:hypothetical protein